MARNDKDKHLHYLEGDSSDPFVWVEDDQLYVGIQQYKQKVNFCPVCGLPAGAPVLETMRNEKQPIAVPNDGPAVWDLVMQDMNDRDKMGTRKHGTRLQPNNGRDAMVDAYQEALDLVVYLRQAIYERDDARLNNARTTIEERDRLRRYADAMNGKPGTERHLFAGHCPDNTQPDSRDPECDACLLLLGWLPIATAPKDGTVVTVRFFRPWLHTARKGETQDWSCRARYLAKPFGGWRHADDGQCFAWPPTLWRPTELTDGLEGNGRSDAG